jgi:hypothetical protein
MKNDLNFENTLEEEKKTAQIVEKIFNCQLYGTSKYCSVDFLIFRENEFRGLLELKNRYSFGNLPATVESLQKMKTFLIPYAKFEKSLALSFLFGSPLFLITDLMEDDFLAVWQISNEYGNQLIDVERRASEVAKNCLKIETVTRENAFLKFEDAKLYRKK